MHLSSYNRGSVRILVIPESITSANATTLNIALLDQARDTGFSHAVVDMHDVGFLCSAGVGALVQFLKALRSRSGRVALARVQPEVWSVLSTMHLIDEFVVAEGVPEAVTALEGTTASTSGRFTLPPKG